MIFFSVSRICRAQRNDCSTSYRFFGWPINGTFLLLFLNGFSCLMPRTIVAMTVATKIPIWWKEEREKWKTKRRTQRPLRDINFIRQNFNFHYLNCNKSQKYQSRYETQAISISNFFCQTIMFEVKLCMESI